jgi:hypothetical protein
MTHTTDELVRRAAPVTDAQVEALDLGAVEAELRSAILARTRGTPRRRARAPRLLALVPRRRSLRWSLVAVAAAALALAGVSLTRDGGFKTGPDRVFAAGALRVADAVPRIAIGAPGWHVERVDVLTVQRGEVELTNGTVEAELRWQPSDEHAAVVADRAVGSEEIDGVEVLGAPARAFRYNLRIDNYTVVWLNGGYSLELQVQPHVGTIRVDAGQGQTPVQPAVPAISRQELLALIGSLKLVSVDEWLGAMPASLVRPADTQTAVERMVSDMTLPDGFDVAALADQQSLRDRYQLGAKVAGAVACDWIGRWMRASQSGDDAAAAQAADALAGSRDWAILHEMEREGDYPEVLWRLTDAIATGGTAQMAEVAKQYREALGCEA